MGVSFCSRARTGLAIAGVVGVFSTGSALSVAQSPPRSPRGMPDIVGLYPGMPVGDAYNLLKAYYPTRGGRVDVHQATIQGLNSDKPLATQLHIPPKDQQDTYDDVIDVMITLPPNKQAVWAVNRTVSFEPGKAPSASAVIAGLRQKYGPEMPGATVGQLRWIFDRQGKRMPDDFARKCNQASGSIADGSLSVLIYNPSGAQFGNLTSTPAGVPGGDACKTFVYIEANVSTDLNGIANSLMIYIYDLGMGLNAGMRTEAAIRGVANAQAQQAQQQQKEIDKTVVPKY